LTKIEEEVMRLAAAALLLLLSNPPASDAGDSAAAVGAVQSIPGDCDNNGIVDLTDFAEFTVAAQGPACGGASTCRCYDLNGDQCVDLADFGALQIAFGAAQDTSGPPPNNVFVLQLADYHDRCATADGGDFVCNVGDPCCQTQTGPTETLCTVFQDSWSQFCDLNDDGSRDRQADLDTLAEWNDFFWEPDDPCNLLAREHYPPTPTGESFTRHFIPMCTDGSTPPKGTTVCPDGQPIIQCTDGTRPVFYYDTGTSDRWIIKVQNGGVTCSGDCWEDEDRVSFSGAWAQNRASRNFTGLYRSFQSSPFASYNRVIIDKCVGDRNCGSNTLPQMDQFADDGTPKGQASVYFHGFRELQAILKHLTQWDEGNQLTPNSQIAISAHSNGSNGMYMYIDRLADYIRHDPSDGQPGLGLSSADVRGLPSSYVRPSVELENLVNDPSQDIFSWSDYAPLSFDDHIVAPFSTMEPDPADGLWYSSLTYYDGVEFRRHRNWGATLFDVAVPANADQITGAVALDQSCLQAHGLYGGGGGNVEACLDSMHVLMNHVTTPLFLSPQLYDHVVRDGGLLNYTKITDAFDAIGYTPDTGSTCGSHDENFICTDQAECPEGVAPCDLARTKAADYHELDFALRVRAVARGAVNRSSGSPEETPADVQPAVSHAVFAPESSTHDSWEKPEKMDYEMCDNDGSGGCDWQSAPLWAVLKSWLEFNATVICVERDLPGTDPNRPLTAWSETTPGPYLDNRCGPAPK
jgi:Pectinacetylesterase